MHYEMTATVKIHEPHTNALLKSFCSCVEKLVADILRKPEKWVIIRQTFLRMFNDVFRYLTRFILSACFEKFRFETGRVHECSIVLVKINCCVYLPEWKEFPMSILFLFGSFVLQINDFVCLFRVVASNRIESIETFGEIKVKM